MVVGSAATDVFSLLIPSCYGVYAIGNCENKDEKISTALKTCIPLVGAFGTSLYGTVKMLSGAKNILFGIGSGYILNKIGSYINDLFLDYKKSGSVVNVAKEEGKTVLSDFY